VTLTVNKINKPPVAAFRFVPETPKINERVCFDARESRDPDGKIVQYAWDFDGDGTFDESVTEPQICRVFESVGNFNVTLRVTDEDGATAEFTKTVTIIGVGQMVSAIPRAQFTFSPAAPNAGEPVTFDASASQSGNGAITQYEWDWNGDGTFDETVTTPISPTHLQRFWAANRDAAGHQQPRAHRGVLCDRDGHRARPLGV
jgi:PKD repeat protein